jgi:hypothetical protein
MTETYLLTLAQLRVLVGFLGERAQYGWWPTAFYETSSRPFLEPIFTKTSQLAQYHGVLEAARRLHDEHLSSGSYHVFRLPEETEQDLHAIVQSSAGEGLTNQVYQGRDAALATLRGMSPRSEKARVGPIAVGKIINLNSPNTLQAIAGTYLWAFSHNAKSYPYLAG